MPTKRKFLVLVSDGPEKKKICRPEGLVDEGTSYEEGMTNRKEQQLNGLCGDGDLFEHQAPNGVHTCGSGEKGEDCATENVNSDNLEVEMRTGRWCAEEHLLFLRGLAQHGQNYGAIAALVNSRTMLQCRTHGQKHFQKIARKAQQSAVVKNAVPSDATPKLGLEDSAETTKHGGGAKPFPSKLMDMLSKEEVSVVSWLPTGDAFIVRDNKGFVSDVLPKYFRHAKVS